MAHGGVALAVCKVFLLDLAGLEGLWRAASFIGLGANLIGIAYLYRGLMPPRDRSTPRDEPIMRAWGSGARAQVG
jgi:uncharacterized membrane protein